MAYSPSTAPSQRLVLRRDDFRLIKPSTEARISFSPSSSEMTIKSSSVCLSEGVAIVGDTKVEVLGPATLASSSSVLE